jgi:prepilin peptidase CpaA
MTVFQIIALGVVLIAVVWDVASRRIPNVLTFGSALFAIAAHAFSNGWSGLGFSLAGWAVGVALFFPPFALGGMGAGDVKLLGAIGAWLGAASVIWVGLFSGIAGGVLAIVVAAFSGYLVQAFRNVWGLLLYWRVAGLRPQPELTLTAGPNAPRLAYAVPMLAGLMVTLWFR